MPVIFAFVPPTGAMTAHRQAGQTMKNLPSFEEVVAAQLKLARKRHGWSQQAVVDRLEGLGYEGKLDRSALSRIEAGSRRVTIGELAVLCFALGVAPLHVLAPFDDAEVVELTSS